MKEKFKPNKGEGGITLIALIITIIILVILAVVSIRAVYDMGIMRYAVNTAEDYREAVEKEESILGSLENVLATHKVGSTETSEPMTKEELENSIGKYVDYQSIINTKESKTIYDTSATGDNTNVSYTGEDNKYKLTWTRQDLTWRILDVDEDENIVRLIAATPDTQTLTLSGANGYNNAVKILNDICSNCYSSSTLGVTARSINIEDLERNGIGNVGQGSASMDTTTSMTYTNSVPTIALSEINQWPQGTSSGSHTIRKK